MLLLEQPSLPCLMVQLVAYNTFFKSHHSLRMEDILHYIFYIDLIIGHIRIGLPLCTTLFTCWYQIQCFFFGGGFKCRFIPHVLLYTIVNPCPPYPQRSAGCPLVYYILAVTDMTVPYFPENERTHDIDRIGSIGVERKQEQHATWICFKHMLLQKLAPAWMFCFKFTVPVGGFVWSTCCCRDAKVSKSCVCGTSWM